MLKNEFIRLEGYFCCTDPNAWFNKNIFFYAKNIGFAIHDVLIVVNNNSHHFKYDYWSNGSEIVIDESEGVKFDNGSTVVIYSKGIRIGEWHCTMENPTILDVAIRAYKAKPRGLPIGKALGIMLKKLK